MSKTNEQLDAVLAQVGLNIEDMQKRGMIGPERAKFLAWRLKMARNALRIAVLEIDSLADQIKETTDGIRKHGHVP